MENAWAKGLMSCPKCGSRPARPPADLETLVRCEACGHDAPPLDWRPDPERVLHRRADDIPPGTRIRREGTPPGDCVWQIPASGKFGFFGFFGLSWTAITALVTCGFLFGTSHKAQPAPWFIYLSFAIFWAVGLGTLYAAVRSKYARHRLTVTRDLVTLRRELLGRVKEKSLVTCEVFEIEQKVFYQQNYASVYGVEIRGRRGKLRFGTTLSAEEKAWLVADIRRAVSGGKEEVAVAAPASGVPPQAAAALRQSSFSFPVPLADRTHWVLGFVFLLAGLTGPVVFWFFMKGPRLPVHGPDGMDWIAFAFELIFGLFSLIPIVVGIIFAAIGANMVRDGWPNGGRESRLEADEAQVALRVYRNGRIVRESQTFPRGSVREVRATKSGAINDKPMKRIDLIVDGKAKPLARWVVGETADAWVAEVNGALGS